MSAAVVGVGVDDEVGIGARADGVEEVVLLADDGSRIGTAAKADVHTRATPLHLAFSCYGFDGSGRVLLTRRALGKRAWPGVWTNTCCGHPAPGEDPADAVARRVREELGLEARDIRMLLPDFRYRAVDPSGIVEHEICPVFAVRLSSDPHPDPAEVMDWAWVEPAVFLDLAGRAPFALSPWSVLQADELRRAPAGDFA